MALKSRCATNLLRCLPYHLRPPYPYCNCPMVGCWRRVGTLCNGRCRLKTLMAGGTWPIQLKISTCWLATMGHSSIISTATNTPSVTVSRAETVTESKPSPLCCYPWNTDCNASPIWAEFHPVPRISRYFPSCASLPRWSQPGSWRNLCQPCRPGW